VKPLHSKTTNFLRENLFNSIPNGVLTIVLTVAIIFILFMFLDWAIVRAVWTGESKELAIENFIAENTSDTVFSDAGSEEIDEEESVPVPGAMWAFIGAKLRFFLYGFYPEDHIWRINIYYILVLATLVPLFLPKFKYKIHLFLSYFLIWPLLTELIVSGGVFFERIASNDWGGLALTIILSLLGLLFSFPLGLLVALGRRSKLPVIRGFSTAYIEFFRGIPLITILFMSSVVVPFFLPPGVTIDKMMRVVVGMSLFQSAYLAEVFRGGFQAIPKGQYEAADSLGMTYFHKTGLIIMPQVLKSTISNIGGISISFIKDTTLVLIIGIFDLLGIVGPTSSDSDWLGLEPEGYIFAGLVYWALCFIVSKITLGIEKKAHALPEGQALSTEKLAEKKPTAAE
jgi:general L-amino acid transport system permease protein